MPVPAAEPTPRGSGRLSWGWGRGLQLAWVPWCSQEHESSPPAAATRFLFCHWQAADAPSGSSDIRKISAQEAAFLRVCVCTQGETPVPMGLGTPGPRFMQHCGAGGGWGESQASANEFWEPGKEAPGPCVNEAKHGQIAMSHCSVLPVCLSPSHPAIPAK